MVKLEQKTDADKEKKKAKKSEEGADGWLQLIVSYCTLKVAALLSSFWFLIAMYMAASAGKNEISPMKIVNGAFDSTWWLATGGPAPFMLWYASVPLGWLWSKFRGVALAAGVDKDQISVGFWWPSKPDGLINSYDASLNLVGCIAYARKRCGEISALHIPPWTLSRL